MTERTAPEVGKLQHLIRRLRAPDGCPWDRAQALIDVRAYLIEEAHEAAAAIDSGDPQELEGELGDLLFQIVFIAELTEEAGDFTLGDVIDRIHDKMIERHPHVFGDASLPDADAVKQAWDRRKLSQQPADRSLLAGVPSSLPALTASYRMTQKASGVGFDWPDPDGVMGKVREELGELEQALAEHEAPSNEAREELGDLLFALANLGRHLGFDPEAALAQTNRKFRRRFAAVERGLAERGRSLGDATLEEMDALWDLAKKDEKGAER